MNRIYGWVSIAIIPWLFFCIFSLYSWSVWRNAMTVDQAYLVRPDLVNRIQPQWKSVVITHGNPDEWKYGTKEQNPEGYAAACWRLGIAISGLGVLVILSLKLSAHTGSESSRSRSFYKNPSINFMRKPSTSQKKSAEILKGINRGERAIKQGRVCSHKQAKKKLERWLK